MLKQVESGYTDLEKDKQTSLGSFIPAGFALLVLLLVTSAIRLDMPFLFAVAPIIWFLVVPIWDCRFGRPSELSTPPAANAGAVRNVPIELSATAAGLATVGVLMVAATAVLSAGEFLALSITGGILLSLAADPAIQKQHGQYVPIGGYAGLRSWLFQGMLLLPILSNSARCRHHNAASSQNDECSARMGETFFDFLRRFIVSSFTRSLALGTDKALNSSAIDVSETDDLTKLSCFSLLFLVFAYVAGDAQMVLLVIVQAAVALWQILAIEYTEHYGILSKDSPTTNGERRTQSRTWTPTGTLNNVLLSGRTGHSSFSNYDNDSEKPESGKLPYGFNLLSVLVLWPSKWFRLVDARLAESVNFDLHEVNLGGNAYVDLMEKYHHQGRKIGEQT